MSHPFVRDYNNESLEITPSVDSDSSLALSGIEKTFPSTYKRDFDEICKLGEGGFGVKNFTILT